MKIILKKNKKLVAGLISLSFILIFLDQITKYCARKTFLVHSSATEIHDYLMHSKQVFHIGTENWLNFSVTYVRNTGAAWGLFGNLPEYIRPYFFYVLTAVAIILILYFFLKTTNKNFLTSLSITFILSGAAGNYIDRIFLHYVVDWLHFEWKIFSWQYDYPVFNIADTCVSIGVILLVVEMIFSEIRLKFFKQRA